MLSLKKISLSLRGQIIFLVCGMTFISSLLIGGFNFFRTVKITLSTAMQGLAGETRLMALRFSNIYKDMENDAFVVARTPPIKGIMRSTQNNGIDPVDGSTTELWRKRLETIFSSIMESREHYTQMRYIGVIGGGYELVRVNRTESGLIPVAYERLQSKKTEDYFQQGALLKPNEIFFSDVSYNREHGKLDGNLLPTLRTVVPLFDDKKLFGMIVINADYPMLLKNTFEEISPKKNTFIINHTGDYMEYKKGGEISNFQFHDKYEYPPPEFIKQVKVSETTEQSIYEGDEIIYFVKLKIDPKNERIFLGLALRADKNELLEDAYEIQRDTLLLIFIVILVCLFIAVLVSTRLALPLKKMTIDISSIDNYRRLPNLPVERNDEIGDFARAFHSMMRHLQRSEEKSNIVLENVVDGIITFDCYGVIDSVNPACKRIFGYLNHVEQLIGKDIRSLIPSYSGTESLYALNKEVMDEHNNAIGSVNEAEGRRENGSLFPIDLSISKIEIDGSKLFVGVIRDITERKHMETIKNEFISTVNHELRTPITSINGSIGLLKAAIYDVLDKKGKRLLDISYKNCEQLTHLVNDILDMEKIAAGKMEYNIHVVEMCDLTCDVINRHEGYADKYKIKFVVKKRIKEVYCRVDPGRFNQALVNLISNAAKFSPEGDEVTITLSMEGMNKLRISVADHGPGIALSFRSKIFDKFSQEDSSTTRAEGGTGLGLNITKSIIEKFSGEVTFDTEVGKGTTFHFILPVYEHDNSLGGLND